MNVYKPPPMLENVGRGEGIKILHSFWEWADEFVIWDVLLSIILNIVCGLLSGLVVTIIYRKIDKKKELYSLIYGLYSYLNLTQEATSEYAKSNQYVWLKTVLKEEPYNLFVGLKNHKVDEEKQKAISDAIKLITEMQMLINRDDRIAIEASKFITRLAHARLGLLKVIPTK